MPEMTSRERVLAAFNHQEPDRLPRDLGSKGSTIALGAYADLLGHLGVDKEIAVLDQRLGLADIDEEILERFHIDTRYVYFGPGSKWNPRKDPDEDTFFDEWGGLLKRPRGGYYYDHVRPAFAEPDPAAFKGHDWPDPDDPARYAGLRDKAKAYYDRGFAVGSYMKGCFETMWILRGMENAFKDMLANPAYYAELADIVSGIQARMVRNFFEATKPYVQFFCVTCDLGTQLNPLISPKLIKSSVLPYERRIHDEIRAGGAKVVHHSCGAIFKIIPLLIDIGVDVINPVQLTANGMDAEKLKREYGDRLSFWGGLDTQQLVPKGTPEQIKAEVARICRIFHDRGGYLFASCHDIQIFTPPENIVAIFEAAERFVREGRPA